MEPPKLNLRRAHQAAAERKMSKEAAERTIIDPRVRRVVSIIRGLETRRARQRLQDMELYEVTKVRTGFGPARGASGVEE